MKEPEKNVKIDAFSSLSKDRRTLVALDVDDNLSNKELTALVHRKREGTISDWRKTDWYKRAREAYVKIAIKGKYKIKALKTLVSLLDAKSEMVRLQAATTLLKMAGMLSDNDTPELTQAKIRKANADARVAEARAKSYEDGGQDVTKAVGTFIDLLKEGVDQNHENQSKQSSDS